MSEPVISLQDVSMGYRIYPRPFDIVKETILGGVRHDTFWALRDINLTVNEGDRLGIVGPNGAGKSTLLKIICGNLSQTSGRVSINGRISSLLSMTPAWNEEESGIENIKYNLLLQGVRSARIAGIIEDIVDFTELGAFIYRPVKTYSTGMGARLSFAIATATDPDILIIDEVLGTGDGYFAGKATARMKEFCARGRALIFVSHAVAAVQQMCDRVLWMESGSIRLDGQADYVIRQYEMDFRKAEDESTRAGNAQRALERVQDVMPEDIPDQDRQLFRLVAEESTHFGASHYVRSIQVRPLGGAAIEVPVVGTEDEGAPAGLSLLGTEWGRLHDRAGQTCRLLARATGRKVGGRFAVAMAGDQDVAVEVVSACPDDSEKLALEWMDLREGRWRRLERDSLQRHEGEWMRYRFSGAVTSVAAEQRTQVIEQVVENALDDVEIIRISATAQGQECYVVTEEEPFSISVKVVFRRRLPWADMTLKFTRSDGVHAFWTSLGAQGANLENPLGTKLITFRFDPNRLGAGTYNVSSVVASRFKHPEEWPYTAVYARQVDAIKLTVNPRMAMVNKGLLNQAVDVEITNLDAEELEEARERAPVHSQAS